MESDEQYTPAYIFDALGCEFDMDVASPEDRTFVHVPAKSFITKDSLSTEWIGFVWMNAPYGKRGSKDAWIEKIIDHQNGIALWPDRTSAPWWPKAAREAYSVLFITGKVKFIKPDGSLGNHPENGTCLFAYGHKAHCALLRAQQAGLGIVMNYNSELP